MEDLDGRVLQLETVAKVMESEVASLRASRHEHSQWMNRHNLEINELRLKVMELSGIVTAAHGKMDTMEKELHALRLDGTKQLGQVRSDLRQTAWVVSVIVGIVVFVGRAVASKFGL